MKYDKRIVHPTDNIWTPFGSTSDTNIYAGIEGYFTDYYYAFRDLDDCKYGVLTDIDWNAIYPYCLSNEKGDVGHFSFFLPARDVKPKEKKLRPFASTEEFFRKTNFTECDLIHIRSKPNNFEYHLVLVGWTDNELMLGSLCSLSFDELFQKFELWDGEDKFIPFGVEES